MICKDVLSDLITVEVKSPGLVIQLCAEEGLLACFLYMFSFIYFPIGTSLCVYLAQKATVEVIGRFRILPVFLHPDLFKDGEFWKVL